ncbi:MAG: hypothetical protein HY721_35360 [Planctomycetes bacterium]|nr:hypothetical protein [Planctomycetota bacterium]
MRPTALSLAWSSWISSISWIPWISWPALSVSWTALSAQTPPEPVRVLCDPADPANRCPGPDCVCLEDSLEVTFDRQSQSVLDLTPFEPGRRIETAVVLDAKSPRIQGWSYAVEHEEAFLTLEAVTVAGTAADVALSGGFVVADMADIEACSLQDLRCLEPRPGSGYIAAVILSFTRDIALPLERDAIGLARYAVTSSPGLSGTLIVVVDGKLKKGSSPPVVINITVDGKSRLPSRIVDGWVGIHGDPTFEDCTNQLDDDGDGATDCADRDCEQVLSCLPKRDHCTGGADEDGDGLADCADPDCGAYPACLPKREQCSGGADEDGDGLADCADPDCGAHPACRPGPEVCDNGGDDDGDGAADCADADCSGAPNCPPLPEACANFRDDDRDGAVDCADPDCAGDPACIPRPEECGNFRDDDLDGRTDCDDADCARAPNCAPPPEACDNGRDDDRDGAWDCADPDCAGDPACIPRPEECANLRDDDLDGLVGCDDPDCAALPDCAPRPEVCGNRRDDDRDGARDCADADCFQDPACGSPPEGFPGRPGEICGNCRDDDRDGKVDCEDPRCATFSGCRPELCDNGADDDLDGAADLDDADCAAPGPAAPACPDFAFYFGPSAASEDLETTDGAFVISLRNARPVAGFSLGVKRVDRSGGSKHQLAGHLGAGPNGRVGLSVTLEDGEVLRPHRGNKARGPLGAEVVLVERGSALAGIGCHDFLAVDLAPAFGGPGFTVAYAAGDRPGGIASRILPSGGGGSCPAHEVLRVRLGERSEAERFLRADADGSGRLSVADATKVLQVVLGHAEPKFDCDDVLDSNDDGRVNLVDAIALLQFLFARAASIPPPFPECGRDGTPEARPLACAESNCG